VYSVHRSCVLIATELLLGCRVSGERRGKRFLPVTRGRFPLEKGVRR
jgi:hypothetical protein